MASITGARAWVEVGLPAPKPNGLLDVVSVVDVDDPHLLLGAEYQTDACFGLDVWLSNCQTANAVATKCRTADGGPTKTFRGLDVVTGDPFTLYDGIECGSLADLDDLEARVRASLALKESPGVENYLSSYFATLTPDHEVFAVNIVEAVAGVEEFLEANYGGVGVVLMPRAMAVLAIANDAVYRDGGRLFTAVGTPVALGVGAAYTIYGSGQITVLRGPVMVNRAMEQHYLNDLGDPACAPARVLAERTFVPLIECGVVAARPSPMP